MENNQEVDVEIAQQEVVRRYADEIRDHASSGGRRVEQNGRRCYELLNQCAMELAELTRRNATVDTEIFQ